MPSPWPEPDQVVRVRSRLHLVEAVEAPTTAGDSPIARLACVDDDAQGDRASVLWDHEPDAAILDGSDWHAVARRGFDEPRTFAAWVHSQRWRCVTSTESDLFQAPYRAGIAVKTFQLEPLAKALALPRVNLLIADDVGLGKTIEAGLIVRELLQRQRIHRVVVCCPAAVELQWQEELEERFGLRFAIYDREFVERTRQQRGFAVNPWATGGRFILSHARLRDESYAGLLRDWLGEGVCQGALLILDEAHHAAPSSAGGYGIDSKFTRAIKDLSARFEHRLFLTATPHNGHPNSFSALLAMLDPNRFIAGVPIRDPAETEPVMVRRLKADLRAIGHAFPERQIVTLAIDGLPDDAPELVLATLLDRYGALLAQAASGGRQRDRGAARFVFRTLQKRLFSSVEAFWRTARQHQATLAERSTGAAPAAASAAPPPATPTSLELAFADADAVEGERDADRAVEGVEAELLEAAGQALGAAAADASPDAEALAAEQRALLAELLAVAERGRHRRDARVTRLGQWLRAELIDAGGRWRPRRVLVFTEYVDTLEVIRDTLPAALGGDVDAAGRLATLTGATSRAEREELKRRFNADPAAEPLRVLLCTDSAREGLNLQAHCADLFHFDLPWNPARLEQRNGRIDRTLQPAPVVRCHTFRYLQRPEDAVLDTLVRKVEQIRREHVSQAPLLDKAVHALTRDGLRRDDLAAQQRRIEAVGPSGEGTARVQAELEAARLRGDALRERIARLDRTMARSRAWLGFGEARLRSALDCSLGLLGAPPLAPLAPLAGQGGAAGAPARDDARGAGHPGGGVPAGAFALQELDKLAGADPSWAETLDSLRPPRRRDQSLRQWRRETTLRPVVFADQGQLDAPAVHLHLEHRVVRRLLARFVAQGFAQDELSRAAVLAVDASAPRVVLLGRLSVFGEGAARLHDELIAVTARWQPLAERRDGLRVYLAGRDAEAMTLEGLDRALERGERPPLRELDEQRLREAAVADVGALLPILERRAAALGETAAEKLRRRGEQEAKTMRQLLEAQRARILQAEDERRQGALYALFDDAPTRQQLADEERAWRRRLAAIEGEIEREPARVLAAFEPRLQRVEPIGLCYLWPGAAPG